MSDLKTIGQELALNASPEWTEQAFERFKAFCKFHKTQGNPFFTIVDFKKLSKQSGWANPKSVNCWGSLTSRAAKRNFIRDTGRMKKSDIESARGRRVIVWEAI